MRNSFVALLFALSMLCNCITSCSDKYADEELAHAEEILEIFPDSAYTILSAIDQSMLGGKQKQALYALLMSAAMDKNYIDTTSFDVLRPAVNYYLKDGSPDQKLKTYYYQGRIFQNQGDLDNALASFVKASGISDQCADSMAIARNFVASGMVCLDFYDIESYIENYLKAARIYKLLSLQDLELDCLLSAVNGYNLINNKEKADSLIRVCDKFKNLDDGLQQRLKSQKLSVTVNFGTPEEVKKIMESEVKLNVVLDVNDVFVLALAYNKIGDSKRALQMLDWVNESGMSYDTLRFQAISVSAFVGLNDYKKAFTTYSSFNQKLDSITLLKFEQKSKLLEERYKLELKVENEKNVKSKILWGSIGGIIFLGFVILVLLLLIRKNRTEKELAIQKEKTKEFENSKLRSEQENLVLENKNLQLEMDKKIIENENLSHRVDNLENERKNLSNLINIQDELPLEVQDTIKERIEMLNSLFASQITENYKYAKPYETWIQEITADSDKFMNSNRLAFQASHPKFIQYFEDKGLDTSEVNYVCLYAIGLKGKEVGAYMNKRSHVNISSAIRKKLGIDIHETNIGIYVRKLLKTL